MKKLIELTGHLLPREYASILHLGDKDRLFTTNHPRKEFTNEVQTSYPQHLYITSSEAIKEGDWFYDNDGELCHYTKHYVQDPNKWEDNVKIIATTDPKLIADGIPEIDRNTKAIVECEGCNGQGYKDKNERDCLLCDGTGQNEVNFLEEYCKRYNQEEKFDVPNRTDKELIGMISGKDTQKGVDVDSAELHVFEAIITKTGEKVWKYFYTDEHDLNQHSECFPTKEDAIKAYQVFQLQTRVFGLEDMVGFADYVGQYYADIHKKVIPTKELLFQFLTKKPLRMYAEMEPDIEQIGSENDDFKIKLDSNNQPIIYFK